MTLSPALNASGLRKKGLRHQAGGRAGVVRRAAPRHPRDEPGGRGGRRRALRRPAAGAAGTFVYDMWLAVKFWWLTFTSPLALYYTVVSKKCRMNSMQCQRVPSAPLLREASPLSAVLRVEVRRGTATGLAMVTESAEQFAHSNESTYKCTSF